MAAVQRITQEISDRRASDLAKEAVELALAGHNNEASRKLREAAALGHNNVDVQAAFLTIHRDEAKSPILDLCRKYALYHDQSAGDEAVKYLRSREAYNVGPVALECVKVVLENSHTSMTSSQDAIIAELARHSLKVRQYFANELEVSTTEFFDNVFERGDDAANCLRSIVLDPKLWPNEDVRLRVEDDLFQLFLAKLMESGHDHDGRALKGIALLLIADSQRLRSFVDEDAFDALLCALDYRLPPAFRGQATLVLSKLMDVAESTSQEYFTKFVTAHISRQKSDDLILAFSAAAHFFPVAPALTAQLFLTPGFLAQGMSLLQRALNSTMVHESFLALLNAACMDVNCRKAIAQHCPPWLSHIVSNGVGKQPSMAATILAKLRTSGAKPADQRATMADDDVSELVDLFTKTLTIEEGSNVSDSIEGLAYSSLKPEIKEKLAKDKNFLSRLLQVLDSNYTVPEVVVGGLSIISNLTQYLPNLSEEQKRISQLKAYANASKPTAPNVLEDEDHVRDRCTLVVEAGIVRTLVKINTSGSNATLQITDKILLNLSRNPKDRGKLAQQGAVKLLIHHAQKISQSPGKTSLTNHDTGHALARILISLNPSLVFPASTIPHITDAIPPLVALIKTAPSSGLSDQPRDLLSVFESLLALTNIASSPDPSAANSVVRTAWDDTEDLLLSNDNLIRRAACELICNLTPFPAGAAKLADGSQKAKRRMHILIAMADVDDIPTRRAAGGALAMLSEHESAILAILELKRGIEIILGQCQDEDEGIMHRGLATLHNIVCAEGENGRRGREAVTADHGIEKLKESLKKTKDPNLLQLGVEILKALM